MPVAQMSVALAAQMRFRSLKLEVGSGSFTPMLGVSINVPFQRRTVPPSPTSHTLSLAMATTLVRLRVVSASILVQELPPRTCMTDDC